MKKKKDWSFPHSNLIVVKRANGEKEWTLDSVSEWKERE